MASLSQYDSYGGYYSQLVINQTPPTAAFMREYYKTLFAYYQQNGLYTYLNDQLQATRLVGTPNKPIRNPAWRLIEFYVSNVFPGTLPDALPIKTENQNLQPAIEQIWKWGNFNSVKSRMVRWFAIYGDLFLKIGTSGDPVSSVYYTPILPENVTSFETDVRGNVTDIRLDIPVLGEDDLIHTETWSKENQEVLIWKHTQGMDVEQADLGTPTESYTFQQTHGYDFVPFVYQQFRDDGAGRGSGAFSAQLDKIDEANRQATRLSQMLFRYNKPFFAVTSAGVDSAGRPLPPVTFDAALNADGQISIGDDSLISLPGGSNLSSLVPDVNFADALAVLESQMSEITSDLPELAFYSLREMSEISGRAAKLLLNDMVSRVVEARGVAESALIKANEMALSVGNNFNLFETNPGVWENGDFDHSFLERPVLPEDDVETSEMILNYTRAGATIFAAAEAAGMSTESAEKLADVGQFESSIGGR